MNRTTVVLADDHAVVRTGYRRLLELEPGLEVVAEFGDSDSVYGWFGTHRAEVLVLDLSMPGRGGLETLRRLKARTPDIRVLVFSMYDTSAMVSQALQAGANGYLTKSSAPDSLIDAVREVARGGRYLSDDVAAWAKPRGEPHDSLSPREFEIFRLLAGGLGVEEIAARLFVSAKTVSNYQTAVRQKLELSSTLDMYRYASSRNLLMTECVQ